MGDELEGAVFCITGTMMRGSRNQVWTEIRRHGGAVTKTVAKKTTHLIANPNELNPPTAKVRKAMENEIYIVQESYLDACYAKGHHEETDITDYLLDPNAAKWLIIQTNTFNKNIIQGFSLVQEIILDLLALPLLLCLLASWRLPSLIAAYRRPFAVVSSSNKGANKITEFHKDHGKNDDKKYDDAKDDLDEHDSLDGKNGGEKKDPSPTSSSQDRRSLIFRQFGLALSDIFAVVSVILIFGTIVYIPSLVFSFKARVQSAWSNGQSYHQAINRVIQRALSDLSGLIFLDIPKAFTQYPVLLMLCPYQFLETMWLDARKTCRYFWTGDDDGHNRRFLLQRLFGTFVGQFSRDIKRPYDSCQKFSTSAFCSAYARLDKLLIGFLQFVDGPIQRVLGRCRRCCCKKKDNRLERGPASSICPTKLCECSRRFNKCKGCWDYAYHRSLLPRWRFWKRIYRRVHAFALTPIFAALRCIFSRLFSFLRFVLSIIWKPFRWFLDIIRNLLHRIRNLFAGCTLRGILCPIQYAPPDTILRGALNATRRMYGFIRRWWIIGQHRLMIWLEVCFDQAWIILTDTMLVYPQLTLAMFCPWVAPSMLRQLGGVIIWNEYQQNGPQAHKRKHKHITRKSKSPIQSAYMRQAIVKQAIVDSFSLTLTLPVILFTSVTLYRLPTLHRLMTMTHSVLLLNQEQTSRGTGPNVGADRASLLVTVRSCWIMCGVFRDDLLSLVHLIPALCCFYRWPSFFLDLISSSSSSSDCLLTKDHCEAIIEALSRYQNQYHLAIAEKDGKFALNQVDEKDDADWSPDEDEDESDDEPFIETKNIQEKIAAQHRREREFYQSIYPITREMDRVHSCCYFCLLDQYPDELVVETLTPLCKNIKRHNQDSKGHGNQQEEIDEDDDKEEEKKDGDDCEKDEKLQRARIFTGLAQHKVWMHLNHQSHLDVFGRHIVTNPQEIPWIQLGVVPIATYLYWLVMRTVFLDIIASPNWEGPLSTLDYCLSTTLPSDLYLLILSPELLVPLRFFSLASFYCFGLYLALWAGLGTAQGLAYFALCEDRVYRDYLSRKASNSRATSRNRFSKDLFLTDRPYLSIKTKASLPIVFFITLFIGPWRLLLDVPRFIIFVLTTRSFGKHTFLSSCTDPRDLSEEYDNDDDYQIKDPEERALDKINELMEYYLATLNIDRANRPNTFARDRWTRSCFWGLLDWFMSPFYLFLLTIGPHRLIQFLFSWIRNPHELSSTILDRLCKQVKYALPKKKKRRRGRGRGRHRSIATRMSTQIDDRLMRDDKFNRLAQHIRFALLDWACLIIILFVCFTLIRLPVLISALRKYWKQTSAKDEQDQEAIRELHLQNQVTNASIPIASPVQVIDNGKKSKEKTFESWHYAVMSTLGKDMNAYFEANWSTSQVRKRIYISKADQARARMAAVNSRRSMQGLSPIFRPWRIPREGGGRRGRKKWVPPSQRLPGVEYKFADDPSANDRWHGNEDDESSSDGTYPTRARRVQRRAERQSLQSSASASSATSSQSSGRKGRKRAAKVEHKASPATKRTRATRRKSATKRMELVASDEENEYESKMEVVEDSEEEEEGSSKSRRKSGRKRASPSTRASRRSKRTRR